MPTEYLAITIAGAVSLGSYEAGATYELLDAIRQHNENPDTILRTGKPATLGEVDCDEDLWRSFPKWTDLRKHEAKKIRRSAPEKPPTPRGSCA